MKHSFEFNFGIHSFIYNQINRVGRINRKVDFLDSYYHSPTIIMRCQQMIRW